MVQATYNERMQPLTPGTIDGSDYDTITGICETAGGIPWGRAVSQGALSDQGKIIGGSLAGFRGISVKDIAAPVENGDMYKAPNNMVVIERGAVWVDTPVAVAPMDPVWINTVTGVFAKATGTNLVGPIPGAYWMDTAGIGGRARIKLRGGRAA